LDRIQKAGLVVVPAAVVIVLIILVGSFYITYSENNRCEEWSNEIENMRAELDGRQDSLGGALDLDGSVGVFRNQFNLEVDRYNSECANVETDYYEENS
jgi:hypothetical protein